MSQRSGFVVTPGVEGLNARGPLKVHPKWRHEESALATLRWRTTGTENPDLPAAFRVVQGLLVRIANRLTSATERQSICRHTADTTHFRKIVEIQAVPDFTGAANRIRTCDPVITNDVLYQLSYCGGPCGRFQQRG